MERLQMKCLLDTHVWIWLVMEPENLSKKIRTLLSSPDNYTELLLSAISPWEFCKLVQNDKIELLSDPGEWMALALSVCKLRLVPLSPAVSYRSTTLPGDFHKDPADQMIVATALIESAVILTKDRLIQNYPHVKSLW